MECFMTAFEDYSKVIFWDYKRRDNVDYNFKIIESMIDSIKDSSEYCYYKPIFLIISSIIECLLYDFLKKIYEHRYEKVPNLDKGDIEALQNIDLPNKLTNFSDICKKYSLLGRDQEIYDRIQNIAKIRNRIHIQNQKNFRPLDESELWTKDQVKLCGSLLKDIFILMCERYPRPEKTTNHSNPPLSNFPEPWALL